MNTKNTPTTPETDWQVLGELDLHIGTNIAEEIRAWLTGIIAPLNSSANFLDRVLKSAYDTSMRSLQSDNTLTFEHIHLSVLAPQEIISDGKNWGFFHITRIENQEEDAPGINHAIDFYLYLEGK
jgi:hypothetical protein